MTAENSVYKHITFIGLVIERTTCDVLRGRAIYKRRKATRCYVHRQSKLAGSVAVFRNILSVGKHDSGCSGIINRYLEFLCRPCICVPVVCIGVPCFQGTQYHLYKPCSYVNRFLNFMRTYSCLLVCLFASLCMFK